VSRGLRYNAVGTKFLPRWGFKVTPREILLLAFILLANSYTTAEASVINQDQASAFHSTVERANTFRLIEAHNRAHESRASNFQSQKLLLEGSARSREVMTLIQNDELRTRSAELAPLGDRLISDPVVGIPFKIIGAGAAIWLGRSVSLINEESLRLDTRVEARARTGSLNWVSSMMNGTFEVRAGGIAIGLNREIPGIQSFAQFHFDTVARTMGASLSKSLIEHVVLSISANETLARAYEGVTQIAYSVAL
jgi:hypothetical protein